MAEDDMHVEVSWLGCLALLLLITAVGFVITQWDNIMHCFGHCR